MSLYIKSLKNALNLTSSENYNLTEAQINQLKGNLIKLYLARNYYKDKDGFPLRAVLIDHPTIILAKEIETRERIFQVMNDTHSIVEHYIPQGRRSDNNVSGATKFAEIADELADIFKVMDLELDYSSYHERSEDTFDDLANDFSEFKI